MELRDYVRLLRRSWVLILACALLGGLLAAVATWRATKIYAATVTMLVSTPDDGEGPASAYQGGLLSQQRVKSYASLVASERIAAAVVRQLGLQENPAELLKRIEAHPVPETVLLRATVRDPDPRFAQAAANAVGTAFSAAVADIERPAEGAPPIVRVSVWEQAKLPSTPVSPRPIRNIAFGVLLGLCVSIGAALIRNRLDTSVSSEADASTATGLANLGLIAYDAEAGRRPLITQSRPHSQRAEAFRQLRTNLQFVDVDTGPRSILVSSSVPGEGKTTTICNLAITLAQGGARVCLVEGDLRRPSFGQYLGIETAAGLTSVLIGAADLDDVLQPWGEGRVGDGRLEVLPSGPIPPNPSELLGSRNMAELIETLQARFDIVLIDAPPLLPVTDAAVLASRVDGVLLIARMGRTRREQLRRAAESLRAVDARMLGTVLNMVPPKGREGYYYGTYDLYGRRGRHARAAETAARWPLATGTGQGRPSADLPANEAADGIAASPAPPAAPSDLLASARSAAGTSAVPAGGGSAAAGQTGGARDDADEGQVPAHAAGAIDGSTDRIDIVTQRKPGDETTPLAYGTPESRPKRSSDW